MENPAKKKEENDLQEKKTASNFWVSCRRKVESAVEAILRSLGIPAQRSQHSSSPEPEQTSITDSPPDPMEITLAAASIGRRPPQPTRPPVKRGHPPQINKSRE